MNKFWMILRLDVRDASTSKKHETYEAALNEIERIIQTQPLAHFVILEPVAEVFAPKILQDNQRKIKDCALCRYIG